MGFIDDQSCMWLTIGTERFWQLPAGPHLLCVHGFHQKFDEQKFLDISLTFKYISLTYFLEINMCKFEMVTTLTNILDNRQE